MKKIQTFASLVALIGLGIVATSCSGGGDTDEAPIKTGTDTLPPAPNQGTPPGTMDSKTGQPSGPGGGLSMPGNKGGK